MDAPSYDSPVRTYVNNQYSMRGSLDVGRSDPKCLSSLGVVDLDLSLTPDVFGLRAFDVDNLLTHMMPGQFSNELRLMIPDLGIAPEGFHDIVIEDCDPGLLADGPSPGCVWCGGGRPTVP